MSLLSGKRLLLLGFIVVLLVAIPLTIYMAQQQQKTKSGAQASTTLTLTQATNNAAVGDNVTLTVNVNPGSNQVSFVKFTVTYDSTKLATSGAGVKILPWKAGDGTDFTPSVLQGPIYEDGTISETISVGGSPQNVIQVPTQIATITFVANNPTDAAPTTVSFDTTKTQVLSIGSSDQFNENVLSTTSPATITITGTATTTTESTTTTIPSATTTTTTTIPSATTTTTLPTANQSPVCTSLTVSGQSSGSAPLAVTLNANGTDSDGTVSKVTFNFGDGTVQDVTDTNSGIGTNTVNVPLSHTYNSGGTFTASAILTDNGGAQSSSSSCLQTISVTGGVAVTSTPTPVPVILTPTPTMAPTGPGQTMIFVGGLGAILSGIGIILLFAL